jgi:hypothetical protein
MRFESPEEEIRQFRQRLLQLGADRCPVRRSLRDRFEVETESIGWGKLMFAGRRG